MLPPPTSRGSNQNLPHVPHALLATAPIGQKGEKRAGGTGGRLAPRAGCWLCTCSAFANLGLGKRRGREVFARLGATGGRMERGQCDSSHGTGLPPHPRSKEGVRWVSAQRLGAQRRDVWPWAAPSPTPWGRRRALLADPQQHGPRQPLSSTRKAPQSHASQQPACHGQRRPKKARGGALRAPRRRPQPHAGGRGSAAPHARSGKLTYPAGRGHAGDSGAGSLVGGICPGGSRGPYPANSWQLRAMPVPAVTSHSAPRAAR